MLMLLQNYRKLLKLFEFEEFSQAIYTNKQEFFISRGMDRSVKLYIYDHKYADDQYQLQNKLSILTHPAAGKSYLIMHCKNKANVLN